MSDLSETIQEAAAQPRRATVDGRSAEAHPLPDQIEADRYLESKRAMAQRPRHRMSLIMAKVIPPGA